jgi:hypothetical protein
MLRTLAVAAVTVWLASGHDAPGPPMPYHDIAGCPFECCGYGDWTAAQRLNAWRSYDEIGSPRLFAVVPGERVTATTGVVLTTEPGTVRITAPLTLEVRSRRFPDALEEVRLEAGDTLYVLSKYGDEERGAWYRGRLLERFDATLLRAPVALIEREPVLAWWVRIRNARGQYGWVRGEGAFKSPGGC